MARKKGLAPKGVSAGAFSHMTAVLENIEQQNRATIEAVLGVERRLTERFEARFEKIELRLTALEIAVRQNSDDIRKNSDDIRALQRETQRLATILGADRDENAMTALENRVAALEARIGASTGR
jgi:hypothetical protein